MERYNRITNKNQREIVLLQSFPCFWGKCRFCDYTLDNSRNEEEMTALNAEILSNVTGEFGVLEVINSGSCFEIPKETLELIRDFMGIPITYKIGVETFDNDFRENYLNKHADFTSPEEVSRYFDSPCLLVGMQGQTKEMIDHDIAMLKKYFKLGTVNIFTNNSTDVKRDEQLVAWFMDKYAVLLDDPTVEVLYEKTDFGVGD